MYFAFNSYKLTYKDNNIKKQIESIVNEALKAREEERGKAK